MFHRFTRAAAITAIAAAAAFVAACHHDHDESMHSSTSKNTNVAMGAINDKCPISGQPVSPGEVSDYKGHTVGFCCAGCEGKWNAMTDAQKDAFVAKYSK